MMFYNSIIKNYTHVYNKKKYATNVEFRTISHLFGIGHSTAITIANHVAGVIVTKMQPLYIRIPSETDLKDIIKSFRDSWGFPQCGGAIDGTHIGILAPPNNSSDYYNRKGFYSIILRGVIDHRLRFWDISMWAGPAKCMTPVCLVIPHFVSVVRVVHCSLTSLRAFKE